MAFDFHVHSARSDGQHEPAALVELARAAGLEGFALTDHDTVSGLAEAMATGEDLGLEVVGGVELSAEWNDKEVHVLGYFLQPDSAIEKSLAELQAMRQRRSEKIIARLTSLSLPVDQEMVLAIAGRGSVGRPHIARAMLKLGYVDSVEDAFDSYLSKGRPAYVPRRKILPLEALAMVREAGGVPVLAHPGLIGDLSFLPAMVEAGLKGLEVYYPEHNEAQRRELAQLAARYGLLATGGSDFHGEVVKPGLVLGTCTTPGEVVAALKVMAG